MAYDGFRISIDCSKGPSSGTEDNIEERSHSFSPAYPTMSSSVQEIAAKAQNGVLDSIPGKWKLPNQAQTPSNVMEIPKTCGILTSRQIEITEQTAIEILEKLATGSLSSLEVTEAFLARAAIAHQLVCTTHLRKIRSKSHRSVDKLLDSFLPRGSSESSETA